MMLVSSYIQQGNHDQAQRLIEEVIATDPDYTDAYLARATIYSHLGRTDKAIEAYTMAINRGRASPPKDFAYISMGIIFGQQGKYKESVAMFKEALKIRPSVEAHNNLSVTYRNMGMREEALREQEAALKLK